MSFPGRQGNKEHPFPLTLRKLELLPFYCGVGGETGPIGGMFWASNGGGIRCAPKRLPIGEVHQAIKLYTCRRYAPRRWRIHFLVGPPLKSPMTPPLLRILGSEAHLKQPSLPFSFIVNM